MIAPVLRAIMFDFNGVLIDDEPIHFRLLQRILGEEGLSLEREEYFRAFVGVDDRAAIELAFARAARAVPAGLVARLVARKAAYYQDWLKEHAYPFFPGAVELVREAAGARILLGVVSGALRSEIEPALRQAEIEGNFKLVVAAEDVERSKPAPEGYLRALQELNSRPPLPERLIHPHEVLAIEDTAAGLRAASDAGLLTLAVAHAAPAGELAGADMVVDRLAGVELALLQERFSEVSRR